MYQLSCRQGKKLNEFIFRWYKYLILNWLVWLATRYCWSNISDQLLMNSIARGLRPAAKFFRWAQHRNNLNGKKPPPHIRITRGLAICLYSKEGSFYRPDNCTFFYLILYSEFNSTKWQLVKICHVSINLSSCFTATLRGTLPILLFQPN